MSPLFIVTKYFYFTKRAAGTTSISYQAHALFVSWQRRHCSEPPAVAEASLADFNVLQRLKLGFFVDVLAYPLRESTKGGMNDKLLSLCYLQ